MNLAGFRSQYPEYDDLPDAELAHGLWRKHYTDIPYGDFLTRIEATPETTGPVAGTLEGIGTNVLGAAVAGDRALGQMVPSAVEAAGGALDAAGRFTLGAAARGDQMLGDAVAGMLGPGRPEPAQPAAALSQSTGPIAYPEALSGAEGVFPGAADRTRAANEAVLGAGAPSAGDQALLDVHRKHLADGTYLLDDQGLTTVNIMGVTGPDGRIYNVPGYYDGQRVSEEEAWDRAAAAGWQNFPSYATGPESNAAAQQLHQLIEQEGQAFLDSQSQPNSPGWGEALAGAVDRGGYRLGEAAGGMMQALAEPPASLTEPLPEDPGPLDLVLRNFDLVRDAILQPGLIDTIRRALRGDTDPSPIAQKGQEIGEDFRAMREASTAESGMPRPEFALDNAEELAKYYTATGVESVPPMLGSIAAGLLTRNPELALGPLAAQVGGEKYSEARAEGRTTAEAGQDAVATTLFEAIPERIPLGILLSGGKSAVKRVLGTGATEGLTEMVTEALQIGYDTLELDKDIPAKEAWRQIVDAGIVGSGMGAAMGAVVPGPESAGATLGRQLNRDVKAAGDEAFGGGLGDVIANIMDPRGVEPATDLPQRPRPGQKPPGAPQVEPPISIPGTSGGAPVEAAPNIQGNPAAPPAAAPDIQPQDPAPAPKVSQPPAGGIGDELLAMARDQGAKASSLESNPYRGGELDVPALAAAFDEAFAAAQQQEAAPNAPAEGADREVPPPGAAEPRAEPAPAGPGDVPAPAPAGRAESAAPGDGVLEPGEPAPVAAAEQHDFASTQLPIPTEPAGQVQAAARSLIDPADIDPENGLELDTHITLKYGLHTDDAAEVAPLLEGKGPVRVRIEGIEVFEGEKADAIVLRVASPKLMALNTEVGDALEHTDTHPDYKPHITLGYVQAGKGQKYAKARTGLEGQILELGTVEFSNRAGQKTPMALTQGSVAEPHPTPEPAAPRTDPKVAKQAGKWRELADRMDAQIEAKMNPGVANQNATPRRARIAESMREDGARLQLTQRALRAMADAAEAGTLPEALAGVRSKKALEELAGRIRLREEYRDQGKDYTPAEQRPAVDALEELLGPQTEDPEAANTRRVREIERELLGSKPGVDFFPTPEPVARRVIEAAGIERGDRVLEPSAGAGNLLEAMADTGAEITAVEQSSQLHELLGLKFPGVAVRQGDFLEHTGQYDRIVMNPPFSKHQDIRHVRHAFELLAPGGRVVAIMSEGPFFRTQSEDAQFRDWLEAVGGTSEELDSGELADKRFTQRSSVKGRLVIIDKPEGSVEEPVQNSPPDARTPAKALADIALPEQVRDEEGTVYEIERSAAELIDEADRRLSALNTLLDCLAA